MKTFCVNKIQNKKILGRASVLKNGIAFFWTASGIELNVKAKELWAEFESDYSTHEVWIAIFINGVQSARLMLNKGQNKICIFRQSNEKAVKNIRIYKETQAMGDDRSHKMILKNFCTDGSFEAVKSAKLKIEFIGDSITSGEGIVGASSEGDWVSRVFGGTKTYAFKLASMLNADLNVLSQSGWGTVASYDNNTDHTLPKYYEQTCGVLQGANAKELGALNAWDFKKFQPNIIVVNLGTNDQGAFYNPEHTNADGTKFKLRLAPNGVPEKESAAYFEKGVVDFLKTLRAKNPKAKIVWCYGMMGRLLVPQIRRALATYKKLSGDTNAQFFMLPAIDNAKTAALDHPSEVQHQAAAEFLYKKIYKS